MLLERKIADIYLPYQSLQENNWTAERDIIGHLGKGQHLQETMTW